VGGVAELLYDLTVILEVLGNPDEAQQVQDMLTTMPLTESEVGRLRVRVLVGAARRLHRLGDFPDAVALMERALEVAEDTLVASDVLLVDVLRELAGQRAEDGRTEEATALYRRAIGDLALLREAAGSESEARALRAEARSLLEAANGTPHAARMPVQQRG
jgi:tetratricopeptide (TPR) repeat protein